MPLPSAKDAAAVRLVRGTVPGGGVELPVVTLQSGLRGPAIGVGANMHGDEANGVGVAHALIAALRTRLRRGAVHIYPSLNPAGLGAQTRLMPDDDLDPNRAYPGSSSGSAAERLAARVWRDLKERQCGLYVDLHTDAPSAIPYAIVDRVVAGDRKDELARQAEALARASGLTLLREYPPDRYLRFGLNHSLPGALLNERGVLALTLEVGPRRCIDPVAVQVGCAATLGVLTAAGVCEAPAPAHASRVDGGPWRREGGPRSTRSGVLVPLMPAGTPFSKGGLLAEIRAINGVVRERITARFDGFVVAWPERALVSVGATTATLALRDSG